MINVNRVGGLVKERELNREESGRVRERERERENESIKR